ncbi:MULTISPECIES: DUF3379 family protein [unclassified Vibrio]|uniref:DUF3379 family protein n=1 Tax=Vibrio sp. HB236076 TaxID=3232307 RepID=A0AB39HFR6_9VIBR|nr:DUF3379 family protein [Vibrio sp. HB161653]MDP5254762.1 DUF3379 family protein [Vibrio sp. HB161653]
MDDLDFRRRLFSDPKLRDEDVLKAISGSDSNAKFAEDMLSFDAELKQAMTVDVPDDLADKILFSQNNIKKKPVWNQWRKPSLSLAASIAFVVGVMAGQINWGNALLPQAQASIPQTAIQHVMDEKAFVGTIDERASDQQLKAKVKPLNYDIAGAFPYHIYYINHCAFGKSNAVHMIYQGEKGKVTLFFVPQSTKSEAFSDQGMDGYVYSMQDASIILVGQPGEDLAAMAQRIGAMMSPMPEAS